MEKFCGRGMQPAYCFWGREGVCWWGRGEKEWLFKRLMMPNTMYLARHSMQVALQLPCPEGANIFHQFDGWHQAD